MDLAKQAFGCNNFELATDIFDHLLQTHGPNMDWLIGRGDSLARRGSMNEALGDYAHAFRLGEVTPERLNELVNALVASVSKKGGLTSSIQRCQSKLKEQPSDLFSCPICECLLYDPTTLLCGHSLCKDCLHISLEPRTCAKCKVNHSQLVNSNKVPRVNIVLGGLLEKYFPEETTARRRRIEGNKLYAQGKPEDAIMKYTEAIKLVPHDHLALSNRSHVYTGLERYDEALFDAEAVCEIRPDWPKGYYRKGVALKELHRQEAAMVAFLQSLTLDPFSISAKKCLAKVLHNFLSPVQPESIKCLELQRNFARQLRAGAPVSPGLSSISIANLADEVALGFEAINRLLVVEEKEETDNSGSEDGKTTEEGGDEAVKTPFGKTPSLPDNKTNQDKCLKTTPSTPSPPPSEDESPPPAMLGSVQAATRGRKEFSTSELLVMRKRKRCRSLSESMMSPTRSVELKFARLDLIKKIRRVPEEKIDKEDYECSLCFRLFLEPLTTPCGHTFCKLCLNRSLDYSKACPLCKDCLSDYLATRNNTVNELALHLLQEYLGEEYQQREQQHKEEMEAMAKFVSDQSQCEVPIFVCTLAFPTIPCPLHIFEPRYRLMVRQTMDSGARQFGMCLPNPNNPDGHEDMGCMLEIQQVQHLPDGRSVIKTIGGRRFKVLSTGMRDGYNTALVEFIKDVEVTGDEVAIVTALESEVYQQAQRWFTSLPIFHQTRIMAHFGPTPTREAEPLACPQGPSWTWWLLAILPVNKRIQTGIMSMSSLKERLNALQRCLVRITDFQF
ncbi:LON peptidase N-terminal domain and RING finger protein 3-like [Asterias rubens]|uniref:LON peptidase N-terminal domain and RING finger protein 3-like n=1 Tax=Asterias rubens TaxID=7604 RepID=UPI00145530D1|nr:LON peptidase N-terminal domain and RING finger protein 3-like [Asterias rubens]XP_033632253.1 LON peptidase N-terminal domain and RING finger protein 3-like [Asterias rubens]